MKALLSAMISIPALGALFGALVLVPVIWIFAPVFLHRMVKDRTRSPELELVPSNLVFWGISVIIVATALRFLEAAGEANIPNSPRQSCDVFQVVDLKSIRDQLLSSSEAYVELQTSLLDARKKPGARVRFIAKVYVFEGSPHEVAKNWPPQQDQVLASGAQFHVSDGSKAEAWKTLSTRCVLPPTAGFLVVQLGAGSAGQPGEAAPKLGEQFADDVRRTLFTRHAKAELAAR